MPSTIQSVCELSVDIVFLALSFTVAFIQDGPYNLLAETVYSSGENHAVQGIESYIPPHTTCKDDPEGLTYIKERNYWICPQGEHVTFRKQKEEKGTLKNHCLTRTRQCKDCPIKNNCIGKSKEKRINITVY